MKWHRTGGWELFDMETAISVSDSYKLTAEEQRPFINIVVSAASKTITLDPPVGATAIVTNVGGTNAFTLKNVSGDTGTSLAAGKVALVVASQTADASTVKVLN